MADVTAGIHHRRVLLTGGLGFLGLNLVPLLLEAGAAVRILNRTLHPLALSWLDHLRGDRSVEVIQGDIADAERMPRWLEGVDLVLNLAGESGAVKSLREAHVDMQVNIAGHLNLLDAIRVRSSFPRVVFVSSRLVYGITGPEPADEEHPPRPTSLYGLHKLTVEHYYRIYHQHYGIPYTILRLTNPYGPFQLPHRIHYGIVNRFVMAAIRGEAIQLFGGGPQLRDYIHVRDAAQAVLRAGIDERAVGETFNVGSGRSISLGEVARRIVDLAGSGRIEDVPWPEGYQKVETGDFLCDIRRIDELLGWRADTDLTEGLRGTVDTYRSLLP
ncbi:MAG TPA: NAD-dependent epimerase/dehydratase family protein [Thermoanaerobaculia bacterium]|nr:NAD-dependent epimerase/dehydratase family protein [Thermoanaerobaculia bacterium]